MKNFLIAVGAVAALAALIVGVFIIKWATAPARGKVSQQEIVQSGNYRIAAYEAFFDQCNSIVALEQTIEVLEANRETVTDPTALNRLTDQITGNKIARVQAIQQYNADARKTGTRGQFRSSTLPYEIPSGDHVKGEYTQCVV